MAEQKISELPAATALDGTEEVPVNQNGITSITDVDAIVTYTLASIPVELTKVKVSLSAAQILALHTTPVELIATPGASKVLVIESLFVVYNFVSAAYTSANSLIVDDQAYGGGGMFKKTIANVLGLTASTIFSFNVVGATSTSSPITLAVNKPYTVALASQVTAGDSTVDFYITYYTINL
jgi:hypothetical protein